MNTDKNDPETHQIIGAAMEVHRQLGSGFLESVYHEALVIEFGEREIPFVHELDHPISYKGRQLNCHFRTDFICFAKIIVEIKAIHALGGIEASQIINYIKATRLERGLLINFGKPSLEFKRFVFSHPNQSVESAQSVD